MYAIICSILILSPVFESIFATWKRLNSFQKPWEKHFFMERLRQRFSAQAAHYNNLGSLKTCRHQVWPRMWPRGHKKLPLFWGGVHVPKCGGSNDQNYHMYIEEIICDGWEIVSIIVFEVFEKLHVRMIHFPPAFQQETKDLNSLIRRSVGHWEEWSAVWWTLGGQLGDLQWSCVWMNTGGDIDGYACLGGLSRERREQLWRPLWPVIYHMWSFPSPISNPPSTHINL